MTGNSDRLDEIEQRAAAATPGPWEWTADTKRAYPQRIVANDDGLTLVAETYIDPDHSASDPEFIAAAREDVPWLVEQLRDALAVVDELGARVHIQHDRAIRAEAALVNARVEVEKFRERLNEHVDCEHRAAAELRKLHAELAVERAKAERAEALCDEYRTNCDPETKQAQVAEIFRVALTGGEQ